MNLEKLKEKLGVDWVYENKKTIITELKGKINRYDIDENKEL